MYATPYADVNALLRRLLSGVQSILGADLVGIYLHGSLAMGDFDPARSDIDFLVVTGAEVSGQSVSDLAAMHAAIAGSDLAWNRNYEGSYIPAAALRWYDPARSLHPAVEVDGSFHMARHGCDWVIQRHIVREYGVALAGPPPAGLIDPISADDLRRATAQLLRERWAPVLADPARLPNSEYQAYAVLTMCRASYTLQNGAVATKPQAARWAQQYWGAKWGGLIETALAWRHGVELDRLDEVLEFIRDTVSRIS